MGRRQQSLPSGRGEGERRSGRHRRDHGEAGRRPQAPVGSDGPFGEHADLPTDLGRHRQTGESSPANRKAANRSRLPLDPPTRRRSGRPHSRTNGSRSAASANGKGKRPPGRRSVNAASRPSTRRKRRWTRLSGSTRRTRRPSRPRPRLSRRDRGPRTTAGKRKESD